MALITVPTIRTPTMNMRLIRGDEPITFFGGGAVIYAPPEALWALSFPLVTQRLAPTRAWFAALVQLSKLSNTFQMTPPAWQSGTGYSGSQPLVAGASQLGLSLAFDGADVSTTIALAGDFVEVGGEFKALTADMTSDGAGAGTMSFEPALRSAPADNAPIEILAPKVTLRLVNSEAAWAAKLPDFYDITLDAVEHFGP